MNTSFGSAKSLTAIAIALLTAAAIPAGALAHDDRGDDWDRGGNHDDHGGGKDNDSWAKKPLSIKSMGSFTVGGKIIETNASTGTPGGTFGPNEGHIATNQMYVQYQIPTNADRHVPVVLIHGGTLSGASWETTPDGRMGWYEYFLRKDRAVYVPDQVSRGRSGFDVTPINQVKLGQQPVSAIPSIFTFTQEQGWKTFRFGPQLGTTFPGLKYPVSSAGELARQTIPDLNGMLPSPNPTLAALAALGRKIDGAVLVGHSESGLFPEQAALTDPKGIKGLVSIEPGSCMAAIPTSKEIRALAKIPTLIMFGDFIQEAGDVFPNWPSALAGCQEYARTVNRAGGNVTLIELPKIGIKGNSHMMMQDKNNQQVADVVITWIEKNIERSRQAYKD